ncbi:MAG: NAD(P)/FAD-dependent oxidoreductase [Candidatus Methylomirabilis oxygeniifera]|uniref:NADH:ubiquinone reductase (non-electrogenic) n=1 Tax=Methylomirabilis oxygeniifera TaxID=671143 RepID=D5MG78_METO1|nr:MAG: NAD(P)/FAD-dependent oxidoreductase [Candidatus Methylomirabilis oxyfera]CBE68759.1 putative NADH dehydrogenase FAD-containing subunit transmembrane protein [Candidatus Methylomirabilis oxyfera]
MNRKPAQIVVLGGGFGGLYAAMTLQRELAGSDLAQVTLVDRRNYFTFTPFLPEVAAGTLGRAHVTYPLRFLAQKGEFRFIQGTVQAFNLVKRTIRTETTTIPYDYLIVSLGGVPSFFGNPQIEAHALTLNSVDDALGIRNHVIRLFEQAVVEPDPIRRRQLLTFVVAGAGPCGVELAAELHHLIRTALLKFYPVDPSEIRIVLVSKGERILPDFAGKLADTGQQALIKRGIDVKSNTRVTGASAEYVELNDREIIPTRTTIWAAGVTPNPVLALLPATKSPQGGIVVDEFLKIPEFPEVYVIGDGASVMDRRQGRPYPALAPVAIRQGIRAAGNIMNTLQGRAREPFRFDFTGNIVGLGCGMALVNLLGIKFHGRLGWWLYRMAHLQRLVSFRNKASLALTLALNTIFDRDISCETWPETDQRMNSTRASSTLPNSGAPVAS